MLTCLRIRPKLLSVWNSYRVPTGSFLSRFYNIDFLDTCMYSIHRYLNTHTHIYTQTDNNTERDLVWFRLICGYTETNEDFNFYSSSTWGTPIRSAKTPEGSSIPRRRLLRIHDYRGSAHFEPLTSFSYRQCSYRHIKCPLSTRTVREAFLQREGCFPCRPLPYILADCADKCSQYSWHEIALYKFLPAAIYANIHPRDHNRYTRQNISHVFPIYRSFRPVTGV